MQKFKIPTFGLAKTMRTICVRQTFVTIIYTYNIYKLIVPVQTVLEYVHFKVSKLKSGLLREFTS